MAEPRSEERVVVELTRMQVNQLISSVECDEVYHPDWAKPLLDALYAALVR